MSSWWMKKLVHKSILLFYLEDDKKKNLQSDYLVFTQLIQFIYYNVKILLTKKITLKKNDGLSSFPWFHDVVLDR